MVLQVQNLKNAVEGNKYNNKVENIHFPSLSNVLLLEQKIAKISSVTLNCKNLFSQNTKSH